MERGAYRKVSSLDRSDRKQVAVYIPQDIYENLVKLADREYRSVAGQITKILEMAVAVDYFRTKEINKE